MLKQTNRQNHDDADQATTRKERTAMQSNRKLIMNPATLRAWSVTAAMLAISGMSIAQVQQFRYLTPCGTSVNWVKNNFGIWSTVPTANFSMPGAATNGNSFFVVKGGLYNTSEFRGAALYQRVGGRSQAGSWVNWGTPTPNLISMKAPHMTSIGVTVRTHTNLPKNWLYDSTATAPNTWSQPLGNFYFGPESRIPGSNKHLGTNMAAINGVLNPVVKDYGTGVATGQASLGNDLWDVAVTGPTEAYAVDSSNTIWRYVNNGGLANGLGTPTPIGWGFTSVCNPPGNAGAYATDWNGDVSAVSIPWGITNLGRPPGTHVFSNPVSFDAGKHYLVVAADYGPGMGNGRQRLYTRAYNWGIMNWEPTWVAGPALPSYVNPGGQTVARYIVGSPIIDNLNKIIVMDQEGGYWRTERVWNDVSWLQWENLGKP